MRPPCFAVIRASIFLCFLFISLGSQAASIDELLEAVANNEITRVDNLLAGGADINESRPDDAMTALSVAILNQDAAMVRLLIDRHADVNSHPADQLAPLHLAVESHALEIAKILFAAGAELDVLNSSSNSALQTAMSYEYLDMALWLVASGANPNKQVAQEIVQEEIVQEEIVQEDEDYEEYEYYTDELDHPIIMALKLASEISDFDFADNEGDAKKNAAEQRLGLIDALVAAGSRLDVEDGEGTALVFILLDTDQPSLIKDLIPKIQIDSARDEYHNTAINKAIKAGLFDIAMTLAKTGTALDQADIMGNLPIDSAYGREYMSLVTEILRQTGGKLGIQAGGSTLIHQAYKDGLQTELGQWLSLVDNIDIGNEAGSSLLHMAVISLDKPLAKRLIELGANPERLNLSNKSPLLLALEQSDMALTKLLLKAANPDITLPFGKTLLHKAAEAGNLAIYKLIETSLKKAGASTNRRDDENLLPIHSAINHGQKQILDYLIEHLEEPKDLDYREDEGLFASNLIEYWSLLYWAQKTDRLITTVEKNLDQAQSHPLAAYIWASVLDDKDGLEAQFSENKGNWSGKVDLSADTELLSAAKQYQTMVDRYPPDHAFTNYDLFAVLKLVDAAGKLQDQALEVSYLQTAMKIAPDFWQMPWSYEYLKLMNSPPYRSQTQLFADSKAMQGSLTGQYLKDISNSRSTGPLERLKWLDKWLEKYPTDTRALTSKAYVLKDKQHNEAALALIQKALLVFPFYANVDTTGELLLRLDKVTQLEAYTRLTSSWYNHPASDETSSTRYLRNIANIYKKNGDKGTARKYLNQALKASPNQSRVLRRLAKLEQLDSRSEQHLEYLVRTIETEKKPKSEDYKNYIAALSKSGDKSRALEVWQEAKQALVFIDEGLYLEVLKLGETLERAELVAEVMSTALAQLPKSFRIQTFKAKWLWRQNSKNEALAAVTELLELKPDDAGLITIWKTYAAETLSKTQLESAVRVQLEATPWNKKWWNLLIGLETRSEEETLAIWQQANQVNDSSLYALDDITTLHVNKQEYQLALDSLKLCLVELDEKPASNDAVLTLYLNMLWVLEQQSKRQALSTELLAEMAGYLEQYRDLKGSMTSYYRYQEAMYRAEDNTKLAAQALAARSRLERDKTGTYHTLVADYSGELSKLQVQGYGYAMLQRNPYSENHLASYLHKQLLWQGSAINALKAIDHAKQIGLNYQKSYEKRALNQLGDSLKLFESYRILGTTPGNSKRYINWFENAREDALTKERKQVIYDFSGGKSAVRIVLGNGEVIQREDHPVFGTALHYQKGAAFINVSYTEAGHLKSVQDSSGQSVLLEYNEESHIEKMTDNRERVLSFVYNKKGKPTRITINGIGSIFVSYDADGEIKRIESEQGHKMALQVTQAFQGLLTITDRVKNIYRLSSIPSLPNKDEALELLRTKADQADYASPALADAQLNLAEYLVNHVTDDADYFTEADSLLSELFLSLTELENSDQKKTSKADTDRAVAVIVLWYQIYKQQKPMGLPIGDFETWSRMRTWLAGVSFSRSKYKKVLARIDQSPLVLLKDANWLSTSDLQNTGYWQRYGNEALYTPELSGVQKQALLIRKNGDIIAASDKGFSVLRAGFWEWFAYDERLSHFSHTAVPSLLSTNSNILSLAETEDGVLWLGTANGLYALDGDYDVKPKRWLSKNLGLDSPRINALQSHGNAVYIGTAKGLSFLESAETLNASRLGEDRFAISKIALAESYASAALLILSDSGLWLVDGDRQTAISKDASQMSYQASSNLLYWLDKNQLHKTQVYFDSENWQTSTSEFFGLANDLVQKKQIHEFAIWNLKDGDSHLVINTDLGINIFKDHYFQSMELPFEVSRGGLNLGPRHSSSNADGDLVLATDEGIYTYRPSAVSQIEMGRVYDTLADNEAGLTYIATGTDIRYLEHRQFDAAYTREFGRPNYAETFSSINARILRQDNQGNLITHDGSNIVRISRNSTQVQQLFSSRQSHEGESWHGDLNDIFIASDDTIWAAAGSSVFRYKPGMDSPEEFNYFLDAKKFPSRSHMIYRIYEDLAGKIFIVASDESHLNHKGVKLSGGLLEFKDGVFEHRGKPDNWFVTAYTKIDDSTAIISTNKDFAREKNGLRESYKTLKGSGYAEMKEKASMIWLGQNGARLGDKNTWLFPSAGGVVVNHEGRWFYPDRLNQLLIGDQALGQYGARTVHSVSIDKQDNVYVGTDLGLLVYESHGVASLLTDHHLGQVAFTDLDTIKQEDIRALFVSNIDPDSKQGKMIAKYRNLEQEIAELNQTQSQEDSAKAGQKAEQEERSAKTSDSVNLIKKLKSRERNRQKLLANLERNHYGLYQMLKVDPREIGAMHKKLGPKQALIQYMPVKDKLLIQVVTNAGATIREVNVSKALLEQKTLEAAAIMRAQVKFINSFTGAASEIGGERPFEDDGSLIEDLVEKDSHIAHLSWLYHHLLRPIENELIGRDQIFITPVGKLTYVPFSALIRQVKPKIEYAIDRYNIGILPSMYHFNLVMQQSSSYSDKGLFITDPDGSLPGARKEVAQITENFAFESTVLEGNDASLDNLLEQLSDTKIIHFATHGVLKPEAPEDSYLLLADKYQFNVIDISLLDLEETDLVVLSACESGVGISGMEYATLARAFALAKVPSVVASFWEVDDNATRIFMTALYEELGDDKDNFAAMRNAKLSMIKDKSLYNHPAAWASFEVFGKP